MEFNRGYNEDCIEVLKRMPANSLNIICIDPPYLYLKNQKLERPFNELLFFMLCRRVLKTDGFIICFGRGTSFYRWNTIMAQLGLTFKEEIVWNKSHCTSPLMNIGRVHETISIHTKGNGRINKVKVPYLEMKGDDITSIIGDIKRMRSVFKNTKSLDAVINYLENNKIDQSDNLGKSTTISSNITKADRSMSVIRSIEAGMNEKTIMRTDRYDSDSFTKFNATCDKRKKGDRCVDVINGISQGMNEKSIIKEIRNHYKSIHPTEKPVRLLERLLSLVVPKQKNVNAADFFGGSFSFAEACINLGINWLVTEIDKEYFDAGVDRVKKIGSTLFT